MAKVTKSVVGVHQLREAWLSEAASALWNLVEPHGGSRKPVKVSCGFPLKRKGKGSHAIGQCWASEASKAGVHEIFICPSQDKPVDVLAVLVHELIHVGAGLQCGHKGAFKRIAKACGLEGKMTATVPGAWLTEYLTGVATQLGPYPHRELVAVEGSGPKKQGTRLIKCQCGDCGYTVRTTRKWLEVGLPLCPLGDVMTADEDDGDEEGGDQ